MTIYDISRDTGVSISTVSRVINGKKGVGDKTRKRILEYMREHNFTPNALAQGLGTSISRTVGLMCMDVADIFLAEAASVIERELRVKGYNALLCCTGDDAEAQQKYLSMLASKKVDAIILVGSHYIKTKNYDSIKATAEYMPIIIINGFYRCDNVYCVMMDDFLMIKDAALRLIDAGAENLVYIYDRFSMSSRQKIAGFKAALEESGILSPDEHIFICPQNHVEARSAISEMLAASAEAGKRVDGIIAMTDSLAVSALKAARENGIAVPDEMSIIGYDNSILAETCEPELSSIDNHIEAVCVSAIATLFGVLEGGDFAKKTVLSGELVERGTTKLPDEFSPSREGENLKNEHQNEPEYDPEGGEKNEARDK